MCVYVHTHVCIEQYVFMGTYTILSIVDPDTFAIRHSLIFLNR